MKRFFSVAEIQALPQGDRVRAEAAISVAKHTPGLTAEFVFEHLMQDASACGEWLGQMIVYYEAQGQTAVVVLLSELRMQAVAAGV
jgi:hypothetical protein